MIGAPQGVGKTTLAGMLVRARIGLSDDPVLGLLVEASDQPVLYLAMDRPRQIARSLSRQFRADLKSRDVLDKKLLVRPGPPPEDLAQNPTLLVRMAQELGVGTVVVDSLKDAAVGLSDDAVGAGWNRARQHVLAAGIEMIELHHTRKDAGTGINGVYAAPG
jgi:replicative DNA helicase